MMNLTLAIFITIAPIALHAGETDWNRASDSALIVQTIAASREATSAPKSRTAPAAKMNPETAAFLRSVGVDPESEDVVATNAEGPVSTNRGGDPEVFSLDILASQKKKNGIVSFIATRVFIRKLKEDFNGTLIPDLFDGRYLTPEERRLTARKFAQSTGK